MARLKRNSSGLKEAVRRFAGMRSIDTTLEFGNGLSLVEYDTRIQVLQTQLSSYNTMLFDLDKMAGQIALTEQDLRSYSEKMLMSVATRYGKDSVQYMQAGGKPRKSSSSRSTATPTIPTPAMVAIPLAGKTKTNGKGTNVTLS